MNGTTHTDEHRYRWPSSRAVADRHRWARRGVFAGLLLAAAAFVVYAFREAPSNEVSTHRPPAVVREVPIPGSHVLHQAQVGAVLKTGYDGRITVNGTEIPEQQMDGAIPVSAPTYDPRLGPRPNTRNLVLFTPGEHKVIDAYDRGTVTIEVRYWKVDEGPSRSKSISWTISVN